MKSYSYLVIALIFFACTPKIGEQATTPAPPPTPAPPAPPAKDLSPCQKWIGLPNMEALKTAHVLYRDNLKLIASLEERGDGADGRISELYTQAYSNWKKVYTEAPAADGKRANHYEDGIAFYDHFYFESTDEAKQKVYLDSIKILYNEMANCYGDEGFVYGSMAYDFYYRYEGAMAENEVYGLYKKSMDAYGDDAKGFVLTPFTSLMVKGVREKTIDTESAKNYTAQIQRAVTKGKAKCAATNDCDEWESTAEDVENLLSILETEKGFFDCDYFKAKYLVGADEITDCDALSSIIGRVRWGGCGIDDPDVAPLVARFNGTCVSKEEPAVTCRSLLQEGNPKGAVDCYLEKAAATQDMEKKAQYLLVVAKIYYGEIRRFGLARKYALQAAEVKPNWGEPYMLIGKLYASSGPLCGPGRGWDSQIVTWPAIDTWQKAKRIDPSVAPEANKLINRYAQYMPDTEAIFIRGLSEGESFKIPCWIQVTTKIRAAK